MMPGVHRLPHTANPRCEYLKTDEGCFWCCQLCDVDRHVCQGCGEHVTHLGNDPATMEPHKCSTLAETGVS